MKIENISFMTTDWSKISPTEQKGETGMAFWRTLEVGNVRVRMVEYTSGYLADHWCSRGHVLLVGIEDIDGPPFYRGLPTRCISI